MIISIFGQNNSGKTILANMLASELGFVKLSFADALRTVAQIFFNIDISWKTDEEWLADSSYSYGLDRLFSIVKDRNNIRQLMVNKIKQARTKDQAYRITLELLGTDVFRDMVLYNMWCAMAVFDTVCRASFGQHVVFDDMRFPNEYKVLSNLNTKFVRIISDYEEPVGEHESQKYVEGFKNDYVIYNNGTKDDLLGEFNKLGIVEV